MSPFHVDGAVTLYVGDALTVLRELPDASAQTCVTSPPYWGLRAYLPDGHVDKAMEMGGEPTPDAYVAALVSVFREVRRVLRDDGTLWLNLGDSYSSSTKGDNRTDAQERPRDANGFHSGSGKRWHTGTWKVETGMKPKQLIGIPWRVAFALQADGWYLRSDIIWCLSGGTVVYARTQKGDMPSGLAPRRHRARPIRRQWDDALRGEGTRAPRGRDRAESVVCRARRQASPSGGPPTMTTAALDRRIEPDKEVA